MKARTARRKRLEKAWRHYRQHYRNPRADQGQYDYVWGRGVAKHIRAVAERRGRRRGLPNTPQYVIVKGQPIHEPDLYKWSDWYQRNHRRHRIGDTRIGDQRISTRNMGLDLAWGRSNPPVLWETMIFGGPHDMAQWRYTSRQAAIETHTRIVKHLRYGMAPPECNCDTCYPMVEALNDMGVPT